MLAHLFEEIRRHAAFARRIPGDHHRFLFRGGSDLGGDEAFIRHALERVIAAAFGRLWIHKWALPDIALDNAGERGPLFEVQVVRSLAEVQLRRGFHTVGAMPEVDLVAVEGEDLFLGVALLDPNRDQRLLDLALPAAITDRKPNLGREDIAGELLGNRAAAGRLAARRDVADQREHHARNAQTGVFEESRVFRREDGLAQVRRDLGVMNNHAAFDGELADQLPVLAEDPRNRVRRVVIEGADFREVVGVGKHHPAQGAEQGSRDKQRDDAGMASVADSDFHLTLIIPAA